MSTGNRRHNHGISGSKGISGKRGFGDRIKEFDVSSATVELAAVAVGCEPAHIAKTLSFLTGEGPVLIVAAGDAKIDNHKYKSFFGVKAKNADRRAGV